jgi:transcriptional regulator
MYIPSQFAEPRIDVLHALIRRYPLGTLVRNGADGLDADHLPFELLSSAPDAQDSPYGSLRAHVARANPLWRADGAAVMVLFQGASAYVSPALYDLEAAGGRAVPTWNYAVVHAHGRLRVVEDPAWILAHMRRATQHHEAAGGHGWSVDDAPRAYVDQMLAATVGIEIVIEKLEGKFKLSQNRRAEERERVESMMGLEMRAQST